jgi:ketosteroid isomerase-like protein
VTPDEKKQAAIRLQRALDAGDRDAVDELLHEDFEFLSMERAETWSVDGETVSSTLDKAQYLEFGVPACQKVTRGGMKFTFELAACEGDHVFLLGDSHAISHNGKPYENCYCWYLRFSGDKIIHKREYRDTHLSRMVIFD